MITAEQVAAWRTSLLGHADTAVVADADADAERVALLTELTLLTRAASAVQGDVAVALDASQRAAQARAGVAAARQGRGVAHQIALARSTSPHRARILLGTARALRDELPHTRLALRDGQIDELTATLITAETACLPVEHRLTIDRQVLGDPVSIDGVGVRELVGRVRAAAEQVDPASVVRRASNARADRTVTVRPAPDTMAYLTALLPVEQAVAGFASLKAHADSVVGRGDESRGRGQVMADTLLERLTGQATADAAPVEVGVVLSDASLLGAGHEPATVTTDGVPPQAVPAQIAREIVARALDDAGQAWIRRLYADPDGHLVALSSRQRFHRDGLATYLRLRDQGICRTPYCDAPVRHLDHPTGWRDGTTDLKGQGLCEACNQAKEAWGWRHRVVPPDKSLTGRHEVVITTPTGTEHHSTAPPLPGPARPARRGPAGLFAVPRVDVMYSAAEAC